MPQTAAQIQTELTVWYEARTAAASGSSITIATSAGSRTLTAQDLTDINATIQMLERQLASAQGAQPAKVHNFAVANFNHEDNP
jgi:phenylacetate-coenzyme A ligase PaaK-like adenylate-forming protein